MKYVVDIDGTICEHLDRPRFGQGEVYYDRIEMLNKLYEEGHQIIYYTARGMGEFNQNQTQAREKWYTYTCNQLTSWGCKFNELIIGKYSGDIYIDDKGVHSDTFFNLN
tara:strand:- start:468 stop:794 length:327 start_codon:yes stop_codon:yes gene_type:complete